MSAIQVDFDGSSPTVGQDEVDVTFGGSDPKIKKNEVDVDFEASAPNTTLFGVVSTDSMPGASTICLIAIALASTAFIAKSKKKEPEVEMSLQSNLSERLL